MDMFLLWQPSSDERMFPKMPEEASTLANEMKRNWVAFLKNGTPHADGQIEWPKWTTTTDVRMSYNLPSKGFYKLENDMRKDACDFWEELAEADALPIEDPDPIIPPIPGMNAIEDPDPIIPPIP